MRILMNGAATLIPKMGIGHYVDQLYQHLARTFPDDAYSMFRGNQILAPSEYLAKDAASPPVGPERLTFKVLVRKAFHKTVGLKIAGAFHARTARIAHRIAALKREFDFRRRCTNRNFDLYHEPNYIPIRSSLPTIVSVHDLSVQLFPQWHPAERVVWQDKQLARALESAAHVLTDSERVKNEVVEYFGVSPKRVTAVHLGVSPVFRKLPDSDVEECRRRLGLPKRYFLCVGSIEPRKNLLTALQAFADLPERVRVECPLLLTGQWGWRFEREKEFFENVAGPAGARFLGYSSPEDLPAIYNGAAALLYPSFYEGFGFPPLEMLACGGRVLYAREAATVCEVVGVHGRRLPAEDVSLWREAMKAAAGGEEIAPEGQRYARGFTWQRTARRTRAVYESVLSGRTPIETPAQAA